MSLPCLFLANSCSSFFACFRLHTTNLFTVHTIVSCRPRPLDWWTTSEQTEQTTTASANELNMTRDFQQYHALSKVLFDLLICWLKTLQNANFFALLPSWLRCKERRVYGERKQDKISWGEKNMTVSFVGSLLSVAAKNFWLHASRLILFLLLLTGLTHSQCGETWQKLLSQSKRYHHGSYTFPYSYVGWRRRRLDRHKWTLWSSALAAACNVTSSAHYRLSSMLAFTYTFWRHSGCWIVRLNWLGSARNVMEGTGST